MWEYALWGMVGAAINRALIFLEANKRAKGPAWRWPEGPGGIFFIIACVIHILIGAAVTLALATTSIIDTPLLALGMGASAPVAMAKIGRYPLGLLPPVAREEEPNDAR